MTDEDLRILKETCVGDFSVLDNWDLEKLLLAPTVICMESTRKVRTVLYKTEDGTFRKLEKFRLREQW